MSLCPARADDFCDEVAATAIAHRYHSTSFVLSDYLLACEFTLYNSGGHKGVRRLMQIAGRIWPETSVSDCRLLHSARSPFAPLLEVNYVHCAVFDLWSSRDEQSGDTS